MNLLEYGNGVQRLDWKVEEERAVGFCRVYYITDGEIWYEDANGKKAIKPGYLYFFPSARSYEIHHNPRNPITCLWWHIDLFPVVVSDLIGLQVEKESSFYFLLESLKRYFVETGGKSASYYSMVEAFVEYCNDHGWLPAPNGKIPEIIEFMDARYSTPITVEEISRHFNYTEEHFIRLFQRETGFTPYQYLIHRRMRDAGKMLLENIPIKEVAQTVGYQDTKVFSYRFRQIFNMAPSKYREFYQPMA